MKALVPPPPNASGQAWPILDPAAFYGLPGDVVELLSPHTEADPVAILVTFLAAFGAMAGPGFGVRPHAMADSAVHPARLFPLLVGPTAKARKGTAWQGVRRILNLVDSDFIANRVMSGFGSGEALVAELASGGQGDVEIRDGEIDVPLDRRILVFEPEFARVLSVSAWQGSTMSAILRQAWDGDSLQLRLRRHKALVANDPHVVLIGHITLEELKTRITSTDLFSGYINRFQIICVHRCNIIPSGGAVDEIELRRLAMNVKRTLAVVSDFGLISRTPLAEKRWHDRYHEMAEDDPGGLLGASVARAEAQTLRNSVAFAIASGSPVIKTQHVDAAWALWSYARSSAEYVFEDGAGSTVADTILAAAKRAGPKGVSRTEVSDLLGRHRSAKEIDAAEDLLTRQGRIEITRNGKTNGRAAKRIRATDSGR